MLAVLEMVGAVAWVLLRLASVVWAILTVPRVLRECREHPATALSWLAFLISLGFAVHAQFYREPSWLRTMWWVVCVLSALAAASMSELMAHRGPRRRGQL